MTARRLTVVLALAAALAAMPRLQAYLKLGTLLSSGSVIGIEWTTLPIRYSVTNRSIAGVTAQQMQTALAASFDEWARPAGVALSSQFLGFTNDEPVDGDLKTTIGFQNHSEFDRTLGATTVTTDDVTGQVLEADIFLNSIFGWSVAANGEPGRFDVESILTHELGHLLGLGHSALGETDLRTGGRVVFGKRAVMFPIAFSAGSIADRTLEADDVAGITDIYGTPAALQELGAITGKVTLNGAGVFGAHVTAFNPSTGDLVGGFTLTNQGEFVIAALKPGHYIVRVEPLDDADLDGFFDEETVVNLNFQVAYFARQVAVPAGGTSGAIEIKVKSK